MYKNSMMECVSFIDPKVVMDPTIENNGYSAEDLIYLKKWEGEMSIIKMAME